MGDSVESGAQRIAQLIHDQVLNTLKTDPEYEGGQGARSVFIRQNDHLKKLLIELEEYHSSDLTILESKLNKLAQKRIIDTKLLNSVLSETHSVYTPYFRECESTMMANSIDQICRHLGLENDTAGRFNAFEDPNIKYHYDVFAQDAAIAESRFENAIAHSFKNRTYLQELRRKSTLDEQQTAMFNELTDLFSGSNSAFMLQHSNYKPENLLIEAAANARPNEYLVPGLVSAVRGAVEYLPINLEHFQSEWQKAMPGLGNLIITAVEKGKDTEETVNEIIGLLVSCKLKLENIGEALLINQHTIDRWKSHITPEIEEKVEQMLKESPPIFDAISTIPADELPKRQKPVPRKEAPILEEQVAKKERTWGEILLGKESNPKEWSKNKLLIGAAMLAAVGYTAYRMVTSRAADDQPEPLINDTTLAHQGLANPEAVGAGQQMS